MKLNKNMTKKAMKVAITKMSPKEKIKHMAAMKPMAKAMKGKKMAY